MQAVDLVLSPSRYATILVASLNSRIHYSTTQSSSFESRNGATLWADMSRREMDINTIRSGIMNVQANAIINRDSEYGFQPSVRTRFHSGIVEG